jgi:hypothetical protein
LWFSSFGLVVCALCLTMVLSPMCRFVALEGPERRTREGGSAWEPIKILLKNSAMNAKLLGHLRKLLLPNPRSHWSATGPRRKVQPTAAQNTQRKTTRNCCWQPKPVRLASWDLAIHMQGKPVRPVWQTGQAGFDQEILNRPSRPKLPKTPQDAHNL